MTSPVPTQHQPWQRQEGEGQKEYWAFHLFLVQPAADRTIDNAARMAFPERERAPTKWYEWANTHAWRPRARAWDDHLAERERAAIAETLEGLAHQRISALREVLATGTQIIRAADLSGQLTGAEPLTVNQARNMLGEASRMIANAGAGLRDETGKPERPKVIGVVDGRDLESLSDAELLALAANEDRDGHGHRVLGAGEPPAGSQNGASPP